MEDNEDDKDDCKRRSRNLSEKKRRDQFNALVNELSTMVSTNSRKMDKSTVLKSTISFLRTHNEITVRSRAHDVQEDCKPGFLSNEEFTYLVMEALEGFVMVFSASGMIYYVSESITSLLGHNPVNLVNKSIFDLCYEEDKQRVYSILQNSNPNPESMKSFAKENETRFQCHLQRGKIDLTEETTYELVQFNGHFRLNVDKSDKDLTGYRRRNDADSRVLFVCTGRLQTPHLIRDVSLIDANRNEFTSRHSLEWKFLFLDHRAPPIIGYLPFEVLGTSGYDYYHFDDLENVVQCHEALMQKGELTSCYYRFLTKGQQWIWLQTRFYITYHQWNSKPEFVVCLHRVVSYNDILKTKQEEIEVESPENMDVSVPEPQLKEMQPCVSPTFMSETADAYCNSFPTAPANCESPVKSASSTRCTDVSVGSGGTNWRQMYTPCSDSASVLSNESRSTADRETMKCTEKSMIPQPQYNMGAQFLEPGSFVNGVGAIGPVSSIAPVAVSGIAPVAVSTVGNLSVGSMVPLPFPVIVSDQAQIHEQLQRKHEELQQMIVRQQEELRQVKEQLLLARLGVLTPLISVTPPYSSVDEASQSAPQILYETAAYQPHPQHLQQLQQSQHTPRPQHSQQPQHTQHSQQPQHTQHSQQPQHNPQPQHHSQHSPHSSPNMPQ